MRVEVYLNKKKMGKSSERHYSIRAVKTKTVVYSNQVVLIKNAEFVVQPSGREFTLKQLAQKKPRTVHAFVRGKLVRRGKNATTEFKKLLGSANITEVGYNPNQCSKFIEIENGVIPSAEEQKTILSADFVLLNKTSICVPQPKKPH